MATKQPEVQEVFTKTERRFHVPIDAQLNLRGEPQVETVTYTITAYFVSAIQVVRLHVTGGAATGWRRPIPVEGESYDAVHVAMEDTDTAIAALPYYSEQEDAMAAWQAEKRLRLNQGEQRDSSAE